MNAAAKVGFEDLEYTLVDGEIMNVCFTIDMDLEKSLAIDYSLNSIVTFGKWYVSV